MFAPASAIVDCAAVFFYFLFFFVAAASVVSTVCASFSIPCLRLQLFTLIFSTISWYLLSNMDSSSPIFCLPVFGCSSLFFSSLSIFVLHVHHVIGFGVFAVFHVVSLDQDEVDSLCCSFGRSVSRLFSRRLSVHRVECCEIL